MSDGTMALDTEKISEANKIIDAFKMQGEQRLRDLRAYFMDSYPKAVEEITRAVYFSRRSENDHLRESVHSALWAPVYSNMGTWDYKHDGLIMRATRVRESTVVFYLTPMNQGDSSFTMEFPIALITCPLEDAIATIKAEYKRHFTEVDPDPTVAALMDENPPMQPEQPKKIAAVVKVNGRVYVSAGYDRSEGDNHWVEEKDRFGYHPTSYSWKELRRMGQIEVLFPGIVLDKGAEDVANKE